MKVEIVAEAGVSHGGDANKALQMVDVAKASGADICKFQIFEAGKLVHRGDPNFRVLSSLALQRSDFVKLAKRCEQADIEFLATPGDVDSLKFLVDSLGVKRIKIGSDDLTFKPLVEAAFKTGLPLILSTGMATFEDITQAIVSQVHNITLLHCVSVYPCRFEDANLAAMDTLRHMFDFRVGYSDHCPGTLACVAAAARGACMIEKHFVLDGSIGVPDAEVSAWPNQLTRMIQYIRQIEEMTGNGIKAPIKEEIENAKRWRKGPDGRRPLGKQVEAA